MFLYYEDLYGAYWDCLKNKRSTLSAISFDINRDANLVKLYKDINTRQYEIGRSICFVVHKPKDREVFAATFRDRIVHHVIMRHLEPLFERDFIDDNYNCRKDKGVLYGVKRLYNAVKECSENYTKQCYIGKFDIHGFFMSINKDKLWHKLKPYIIKNFANNKDTCEMLLYLAEKVILNDPTKNCIIQGDPSEWDALPKEKSLFTCGNNLGIPIGNLTSQCFANFFLNDFDKFVSKHFKYYGRYVDDFYIVDANKDKIKKFVNIFDRYLKDNLGLELHKKKRYIQSYRKGVVFTGSVIKGNRVYSSNVSVANAYSQIYSFNRMKVSSNTADRFVAVLNSYLGVFSHTMSYNIRKKLFDRIDPKWFEYIYFEGFYEKAVVKSEYCPFKIEKRKVITDILPE